MMETDSEATLIFEAERAWKASTALIGQKLVDLLNFALYRDHGARLIAAKLAQMLLAEIVYPRERGSGID